LIYKKPKTPRGVRAARGCNRFFKNLSYP